MNFIEIKSTFIEKLDKKKHFFRRNVSNDWNLEKNTINVFFCKSKHSISSQLVTAYMINTFSDTIRQLKFWLTINYIANLGYTAMQ